MPKFEYKVVPAPQKGRKAKGVKTPEARFALSVEDVLNDMGAEGWEYLRAELLPSEERSGLTSSTKNWRNVLVFRRAIEEEVAESPTEYVPRDTTAIATPVLAAATAEATTNENAPRVGPATYVEEPTAPEPNAAPADAEEAERRADLDRLFEPEPEPEETIVVSPEPVVPTEPERRTPPNLNEIDTAPEPVEDTDDVTAESAETPARGWDEDDTSSLTGIERVVRRTAAEQRENSEET
ncbi:MAG: DUF4177 domain-containing protein [Arenibacterium sp.]